jgi:TonB family protein
MRGLSVSLYRPDRSQPVRAQTDLEQVPRPTWTIVLVATASVAGLTWALTHERSPEVDVRQVIAINLAAAQLAMEDGRYLDPPQSSAVARYAAVLALDPQNEAALLGIESIATEYVESAKRAIASERFAEAVIAIDKLKRVRPRHQQLRVLQGLLAQRLEQRVADVRLEIQEQAQASAARADGVRRSARAATRPTETEAPIASRESESARPASLASAAPADTFAEPVSEASGSELYAGARMQPVMLASVNQLATPAPADYVRLAASYESVRGHLSTATQITRGEAGEAPATSSPVPSERAGASPSVDIPSEAASSPRDPRLIKTVQPAYPQSALRRGLEGWVDMTVVIGPSGDVVETHVHERRGSVTFERAAVTAVEQWKYEPRAPGDNSINDRIPVRIEFRLNDKGEDRRP